MTPERLDKSRKEFEFNIKILAEKEKYRYMDNLLDRCVKTGDYVIRWVDSAWIGWQLHQESLVVELVVELPVDSDSNQSPDYYAGYDQAIGDVISALQSAGINYTEKE